MNFKNYTLEFSHKAKKNLNSLDKKQHQQILKKIKELPVTQHLDIKKLKIKKYNLYRLRVGKFRVIYELQHKKLIILVISIGHRKDVYSQLP